MFPIFVLCIVFASVIGVILWVNEKEKAYNKSVLDKARESYKEYESPPSLVLIWNDPNAIGQCIKCGRADCPVIGDCCKWCLELANITNHLNKNGVRRLAK